MEYINAIFGDELMEENRAAALSLDLFQYHVDFFAPNIQFYIQILVIFLLQFFLGSILAVIMYYGIVRPQKGGKRGDASPQGLLVGYGLVIPLSIWLPFYVADIMDIRSVCWRMALVSLPMTVTLRSLEAMHGFLPRTKAESLGKYVVSVGFILSPTFDSSGQAIPLTTSALGRNLRNHSKYIGLFTVLFHVFSPFSFHPFPSVVKPGEVLWSLDVGLLYNTFIHATMMNITLAFSLSGVAILAGLLTGAQFNDNVTDCPMFLSESPSDFWGRRWNNLIHEGLKQGIYKPVRWNTGNRTVASIAAFCMSGVYHEYVWRILFFPTSDQLAEGMVSDTCCATCYCHGWFGKQLIFFCWNGVLIALEYLVGGRVGQMVSPLPWLLRSHLVVLLSLPVGHLFTVDLVEAGYFSSIRQALPILILSSKA